MRMRAFVATGIAVVAAALVVFMTTEARVQASHFCPLYEEWFQFRVQGVAAAAGGVTIEIAGEDGHDGDGFHYGEPSPWNSFVQRDASGAVVRTGTWYPTQLLVRREFSCDETHGWQIGGLLVLRVMLIDAAGVASTGTLTMVNPEGHFFAQESVTMKVNDWGLSFDRPISAANDVIIF